MAESPNSQHQPSELPELFTSFKDGANPKSKIQNPKSNDYSGLLRIGFIVISLLGGLAIRVAGFSSQPAPNSTLSEQSPKTKTTPILSSLISPSPQPFSSPPSVNDSIMNASKLDVMGDIVFLPAAQPKSERIESQTLQTQPNQVAVSPNSPSDVESQHSTVKETRLTPQQPVSNATSPVMEMLLEGVEQVPKVEPEISPPQPQPQPQPSVSNLPTVELSLRDVVILALENNRTIKNQYLERIVQRQDLAVAEDKFVPDFIPTISLSWQDIYQGFDKATTAGLVMSAKFLVKIPTGGEFNFGWSGSGQRDTNFGLSNQDALRQNLELSFKQPFLRGAGADINRASIEVARLNETINLLDLKLILGDKITEVIRAYRTLIQSQERLKIEQESLRIAQQQIETTQVLIDAGRQAQVDIIPVQSQLANQEVSLLNAENTLKQSQSDLLELLDLDQNLNLVASEPVLVESPELNLENLQELALTNQPDYLKAKINVERAKIELLVAEDNRKWNIDFDAAFNHNPAPGIVSDRTEWRAGINLTRELGNLNIERDFKRSQVNLKQAENNLTEELQRIQINVNNRIRDINDNLKKIQLAQRATELAAQQLRNEEEKLKLGLDSGSIVDLVQFQQDLVQARNNELNAKIEYLNSLTNLQQTLGITLDFWDITIERDASQP